MPIGDDFYCYGLEFQEDGRLVLVATNRTFVRVVLGCHGDPEVERACVERNRARFVDEARDRRSTWDELQDGRAVCSIGLSGIPDVDRGRTFSHFGWTMSGTGAH